MGESQADANIDKCPIHTDCSGTDTKTMEIATNIYNLNQGDHRSAANDVPLLLIPARAKQTATQPAEQPTTSLH